MVRPRLSTEKAPVRRGTRALELEITLIDIEPRIWRRIAVTDDMTLGALHRAIQAVLGWTNTHLHAFEVAGHEYSAPEPKLHMHWEPDPGVLDAWKTRLREVIGGNGFTFRYVYDFGDCWEHELKVVGVSEPDSAVRYPVCLAGARARPPEDSGGPWGYADKLAVLKDPTHEEHGAVVEWMPTGFDSEAFDLGRANERLLAKFAEGSLG